MKKKRFYNNKKRNQKWTEKPQGRKIYFADKYIADGGSDKFDKLRPKQKKKKITRQKVDKFFKTAIIVVLCFAIITIGYTVMDIHMELRSMPSYVQDDVDTGIENVSITVKAKQIENLSLDGGVMLDSVISDLSGNGFSAAVFDIKRSDGTIGYSSELSSVSSINAISSCASDLAGSAEILTNNDILIVGKLSCYKDNVYSAAYSDCAVKNGDNIYTDSDGYSYLNPNSDEVYSYILSIAEEVKNSGVTVFVLDDYDLPDDISDSYDDGFDIISQKLYNDLGTSVKILKATSIDITSKTMDDIEQEFDEKIPSDTDDNQIFIITGDETEKIQQYLSTSNKNINYIIEIED